MARRAAAHSVCASALLGALVRGQLAEAPSGPSATTARRATRPRRTDQRIEQRLHRYFLQNPFMQSIAPEQIIGGQGSVAPTVRSS